MRVMYLYLAGNSVASTSGTIPPFHYLCEGGFAMVSHLFFYQLMFLGLLWLCVMLHYAWPNACPGGEQRPSKPLPPPRKRSRALKPFPGLTRKPHCTACEQAAQEPAG